MLFLIKDKDYQYSKIFIILLLSLNISILYAKNFSSYQFFNQGKFYIKSKDFKKAQLIFYKLSRMKAEQYKHEVYQFFYYYCSYRLGSISLAKDGFQKLIESSSSSVIIDKSNEMLSLRGNKKDRDNIFNLGIGELDGKKISEVKLIMNKANWFYSRSLYSKALPLYELIAAKYKFEPAMFLAGNILYLIKDYKNAAYYLLQIQSDLLKVDIEQMLIPELRRRQKKKVVKIKASKVEGSRLTRLNDSSASYNSSFGKLEFMFGHNSNPLEITLDQYSYVWPELKAQLFYGVSGSRLWYIKKKKLLFVPFLNLNYHNYLNYSDNETFSANLGSIVSYQLQNRLNLSLTPHLSFQRLKSINILSTYGLGSKVKKEFDKFSVSFIFNYFKQSGLNNLFKDLDGAFFKIGLSSLYKLNTDSNFDVFYLYNNTNVLSTFFSWSSAEIGFGYSLIDFWGMNWRAQAKYERKLFAYDEYKSENRFNFSLDFEYQFSKKIKINFPLKYQSSSTYFDGVVSDAFGYTQMIYQVNVIFDI